MNSGTTIAIIGLILSMLTSIIAVTTVIVQMRTNLGNVEMATKRHEEREDKAAKDVAEMFVLLKSFIAEQTVTNKMVNLALEGTVKKLEEMERRTGEALENTIKKLMEMDKRTVEASTVVSLLTQILKEKSVEVKGLTIQP